MTATVVTPALLREWPLPPPGGGKQQRGHLLVVAGTATTPGAALLAAEAGLRAGAGKLTIATTRPTSAALAVAVPESMVVPLEPDHGGSIDPNEAAQLAMLASDADAVLVGPGFDDPEASAELLVRLAPRLDTPVVVDATASAYVGQHPDGLRHLRGRAVLTVNPDELAHTAHRSSASVEADPAPVAAAVASNSGIVVLCGGTSKHVLASDGTCWRVEGGSPALGVSGSGDVQAGVLAGLVARGAEPAQAAVWAAYVHARLGERLTAALGQVGSLAREQLSEVPLVLGEVG